MTDVTPLPHTFTAPDGSVHCRCGLAEAAARSETPGLRERIEALPFAVVSEHAGMGVKGALVELDAVLATLAAPVRLREAIASLSQDDRDRLFAELGLHCPEHRRALAITEEHE